MNCPHLVLSKPHEQPLHLMLSVCFHFIHYLSSLLPSQHAETVVCTIFLPLKPFNYVLRYLKIAEWKLSASSSSQTGDNFRCCIKFSSSLRNTDSFGCEVARSPIAGQSYWLDSPLNIILDVLKGTLAACASCSGEYCSSTSSERGWGAKKFSRSLLSDSEPHYSSVQYAHMSFQDKISLAIKQLALNGTVVREVFSLPLRSPILVHE